MTNLNTLVIFKMMIRKVAKRTWILISGWFFSYMLQHLKTFCLAGKYNNLRHAAKMFHVSRRTASALETFSKFSSSLTKLPILKQTPVRSKSTFRGQPHPLFSHTSLRDDVWMIEEKYFISWNRANIFFIKGSNADLLVDTGN